MGAGRSIEINWESFIPAALPASMAYCNDGETREPGLKKGQKDAAAPL